MASKIKPTYRMPFRRRREGKTDYKKRLTLLSSEKPRLVVRKSLKYIRAQIVNYEDVGDKTVVVANSKELQGLGWKFACDNTPAAYLTGVLIAKKAAQAKVKEAVLDTGLYPSTKGSRLYALVKGAIDGGLEIPIDEEMFPSEDRINGNHIAVMGKFKELPAQFETIRTKILGKSAQKKSKSKDESKKGKKESKKEKEGE